MGITTAVRLYHGHGSSSGHLSGVATSGGESWCWPSAGRACVGAAAFSTCGTGAPKLVSAQACATCSGVPACVGAQAGGAITVGGACSAG